MSAIDSEVRDLDNSNPLISLSRDTEITIHQILNNLMNGKKNLALKSHIYKPKKIATLKVISKYLKGIKYNISAKIVKHFIRYYLEYMVSYNRLGRKEIIKAFTFSNINHKNDTEFHISD